MDYWTWDTVGFGGRWGEGRFPDRPGRIGPVGAGKAFEASTDLFPPFPVLYLYEKLALSYPNFGWLYPAGSKRCEEQATVLFPDGRKIDGNLTGQKVT